MKLLLDEMWPRSIALALRAAGHDVEAVVERPGLVESSDPIVWRVAFEESRALVTEDRGFRRLAGISLERGQEHSGLILTTNRSFPRADPRTAGRLVRAIDTLLRSGSRLENTEHWLRPPG